MRDRAASAAFDESTTAFNRILAAEDLPARYLTPTGIINVLPRNT
jgi:hypothetical protein